MAKPKGCSFNPKAILPVQAIILADVSVPPKQASLTEVRQRLRYEARLVKPKENEQTLVYGNTKGHEHFDMLSILRKEVDESRKEREESNKKREKFEKMIEESNKEREESNKKREKFEKMIEESKKEREKSEKVIDESRKELEKIRKEGEKSRQETAEYRTIVDHHENQIKDHEDHIADLTADVRDLNENSEGYLDIRTRFLNHYQRFRGNLNEQQREEIKEGNWRAHAGDAAVDAKLYRAAKRSDGEMFKELYGVQFDRVLKFADEVHDQTVDWRVFRVLNTRGTQVASGNKFPKELEDAFTSYLSEVYKESEEKASYNSSDPVHPYKSINDVAGRARTFWHLHEQFKKSTQGKGTSSSKLG